MTWPLLGAVIIGVLAACFIALLLAMRHPRGRRMRVGFFVEREVDSDDPPS